MIYATTNEVEFLDDATGHRRYHVLEVGEGVEIGWVKEHRDQIWAQALQIFKVSGQAWQRALELAPEVHVHHEVEDSWSEAVIALLDGKDETTMREVLVGLGISNDKQNRANQQRAGKIMRQIGWTSSVVWYEGKSVRKWRRG